MTVFICDNMVFTQVNCLYNYLFTTTLQMGYFREEATGDNKKYTKMIETASGMSLLIIIFINRYNKGQRRLSLENASIF